MQWVCYAQGHNSSSVKQKAGPLSVYFCTCRHSGKDPREDQAGHAKPNCECMFPSIIAKPHFECLFASTIACAQAGCVGSLLLRVYAIQAEVTCAKGCSCPPRLIFPFSNQIFCTLRFKGFQCPSTYMGASLPVICHSNGILEESVQDCTVSLAPIVSLHLTWPT